MRFGINGTVRIETAVKAITYAVGITGVAAVFPHINLFYSLTFFLACALSIYLELKRPFVIPRWLLNIVASGVIIYTLYRFDFNGLITQMLEALVMLIAIKFIEQKKVRDYMQIYAMLIFLLSGLGLLSLNITFTVYYLVIILLLATVIILLTYYAQDHKMELPGSTIAKIVYKSLWMPALAIPLTVVMFVILPRTPYPIFDFLNKAGKARTGFTDNVRLGGVSGIQEDPSSILRVKMRKINDHDLYWRGITLDYFDGISWLNLHSATQSPATGISTVPFKGDMVRQTIYLDPYDNRYLFVLDKPFMIILKNARKYDDFTYVMPNIQTNRIRYEAISVISDTIIAENVDTGRYLQLPKTLSPDIIKLARKITKNSDGPRALQLILAFLNSGEFRYSLKNLPLTKNPLEEFLFNLKFGNCEYFASACTVMLRASGIPSRLVGGYRGGYYNEVGGYYLVPQKNAHVWVEAYIKNKGWLRIDPTPFSIENLTVLAGGDIFLRGRLLFDTINYYWYVLVINYNIEKQLNFLHRVRTVFKKPHIRFSVRLMSKRLFLQYLTIIVVLILIAGIAVYILRRKRNKDERILNLFLQKMARYGYQKSRTEGLEEFTRRISEKELRRSASEFVALFQCLYYKDIRISSIDKKRLAYLVKSISTHRKEIF